MPRTAKSPAAPARSKNKPHPHVSRSLDNADRIMSRRQMFEWHGTEVNTALAYAANLEVANADEVIDKITALSMSPMYRLLVKSYKDAIRKDRPLQDPDFSLATLAARVFLAGMYEGRRGAGDE